MKRRVALVTGASRGLGEAIARRLAREGLTVVLVARTEAGLERVAEAIRAEDGLADVLVLDVTVREAVEAAIAHVLDRHGPVQVLVNNAGHNVRKKAGDLDLATWDALLALDLTAPFHLARLLYPGMKEAAFGRIVNVSSVSGLRALPTGVAYAVAKAGLIQMARNLGREWGPFGITVNAVAPWYVRTPLTEALLDEADYLDAVLACTPARRLGTPEDEAAAVAFLCRDEAGWINGVCLPLDGGMTASAFVSPP
ncbi:MAG: SDR family NAD(P)-dependent oxidoreductase, partial [Planctomycetota bacterium]